MKINISLRLPLRHDVKLPVLVGSPRFVP